MLDNGYDRFTGVHLGERAHITLRCDRGHEVWVRGEVKWLRI